MYEMGIAYAPAASIPTNKQDSKNRDFIRATSLALLARYDTIRDN